MQRLLRGRTNGPFDHYKAAKGILTAAALGLTAGLFFVTQDALAADAPLVLEKSIVIPKIPVGPYSDNLAVDVAGGRIFATPQAAKSVSVLDIKSGVVLKMIAGIGNPHGLVFNAALKRLFVADGAAGEVKVFNTDDYSLIKSIPLTVGADGLVYDSGANVIYASHGGEDAGLDHALLTAIDPERMEKAGDISITTDGLEGVVIDPRKELAYVNLDEADHSVAVVNLKTRQVEATWRYTGQHRSKGIALDTAHDRVYVACRDSSMKGSIVVLNATTGKTVTTLPIGSWADGIFVDQKRQRIYVTTGLGYIETYAIQAGDKFQRLPSVETSLLAKTSQYSSELDRLFVDVPHLGSGSEDAAKVLIYKPQP